VAGTRSQNERKIKWSGLRKSFPSFVVAELHTSLSEAGSFPLAKLRSQRS
jgi:hypothetical protein